MQSPTETFEASRSLCGAGSGVDVPFRERDRLAVQSADARDRVIELAGKVDVAGELEAALALLALERELPQTLLVQLPRDEAAHDLDELRRDAALDVDPSLGQELVTVRGGVERKDLHRTVCLLAASTARSSRAAARTVWSPGGLSSGYRP
jgi:hypothetical protein